MNTRTLWILAAAGTVLACNRTTKTPDAAVAPAARGTSSSTKEIAKAAPAPRSTPAASALKPPVGRRTIIVWTRKAGSSEVTSERDGSFKISFSYRDNARGPTVNARLRLAADGTVASFEAKGAFTFGNVIDERFSIDGKRAAWRSREGAGSRALHAPAFYIPIAPIAEMDGFLLAALSRAGGTLALLPGGEAKLERAGAHTVTARGQKKRLVAWAISGVLFTPVYVWAEEDGTYFGVATPDLASVPEGWEENVDPLIEKQKQFSAARELALQQRLARRPPEAGLAITNARVLDVEEGRWLERHSVVVANGKITRVGPSASTQPPPGALVIDARGDALLPGLWDMHAHLGPPDGILNIASGVTSVRDAGNDPDVVDDYRARFAAGRAIGPTVYRSGFIEGRGANASGSRITAMTPEEAKTAVEFYAKRGYDGIKIYNSVPPKLVPLLARLAHERNMRVSGHIPKGLLARHAIAAGYDEIQHVNMLFLNFFATRETDTNTPLRFSLVAEKAPTFDLSSEPVAAFLKFLRKHHTVVDPTVGVFEDLFVSRPGRPPAGVLPLLARMPQKVQRELGTYGLSVPDGKDQHYVRASDKLLEMMKKLHDARIPFVAGTDSIAGLMLHYELTLYSRAGIPNIDVLRSATLVPARVLRRDAHTGSIRVGKDADLLLLKGDPLARMTDLYNVHTTIARGVVYSSPELYAAVGVRP